MNKRLVLCHGNFDPLHVGHIRHLEAALRKYGDILMVSVAPDAVCRLKGPERPYFSAAERVEALNGLACVTLAFESDPLDAIRLLRPAVYAKGRECLAVQTLRLRQEIELVNHYGGVVVYTDTPLHSSTALMQRVLSNG